MHPGRLVMNLVLLWARLEARVMPASWLHAMGRWSARFAVRWLPGLRAGLLGNARRLLGVAAPYEARLALGTQVLESFSRFFVELLLADRGLPSGGERLLERMRGLEHAEAARARGKGVICVTLHMGNYELGTLLLPRLIQPVGVVYRPDPWGLFERLRSVRRQARAVQEIPTTDPLFVISARRLLEQKGVVLAAVDLGFAAPGGELFPFLGGWARFLTWPAHLSRSTGAPILPCFIVRGPAGEYQIELEAPVFPAEAGDAAGIMQRLLPVLEAYVRRYPEQWLIVHPYWVDGPEETEHGPPGRRAG